MTRRAAREKAFALLFQIFEGDCTPDEALDTWMSEEDVDAEDPQTQFVHALVKGAAQSLEELDQKISGNLVGWEFSRLLSTDKHLLRMSLYELLHTDTPPPVLINEAVLLARKFGGEQSANFINGLLGKVARDMAASR